MMMFEALFLTIPISFAASTVLATTTARALRATLEETAEDSGSVAYWAPYSMAMLYLVPLFVGLLFGVGSIPSDGVLPAAGMTRILTSVLGGCLVALGGIGLQLSKHNQRVMSLRCMRSARRSSSDVR